MVRENEGNTREIVLHSALNCFAQKGFDATSIKDIAKEANIKSTSLIYYYFDSKEALYEECLRNFGEVKEYFNYPIDPKQSFEDFLLEFARKYLDTLLQPEFNKLFYCAFTSLSSNPSIMTGLLRNVRSASLVPFEKYFESHKDSAIMTTVKNDYWKLMREMTSIIFLRVFINNEEVDPDNAVVKESPYDELPEICAHVVAWIESELGEIVK